MIFVNAKFLTKTITGVERYATEISFALKKIDPSIIFLTPGLNPSSSNNRELNIRQLKPFNGYFWEQLTLPFHLTKEKNSVLINLTNTAPIFYRNQLLVIHDLAFLYKPNWYTKKAALAFKILVKLAAKSSKKIVTVSNFTKQEVVKYYKIPADRINVVHGAVPSFITENSHKVFENIYGDYILTVSSLEPRKNIKNLIEAFDNLDLPGTKLVIVGKSNPGVFKTGSYTSNNKNIIFTGYVTDEQLVGLYKNAKLFAYLSYYEGFGFPPIEAIACGCPALVSNTSSLPEVLNEYAIYCNPYDVIDIAAKIRTVLEGNYKKNNKEEFLKKFDWQKSANMILDLAHGIQ